MDQFMCSSLFPHTHHWYEFGMLKVDMCDREIPHRIRKRHTAVHSISPMREKCRLTESLSQTESSHRPRGDHFIFWCHILRGSLELTISREQVCLCVVTFSRFGTNWVRLPVRYAFDSGPLNREQNKKPFAPENLVSRDCMM